MTATTISTTGITLITITGRIAEIIVDPTSKAIPAGELVLFMLAHGITAAKVVNSGEINPNPAMGAPDIDVARNAKRSFANAKA
jgi:hypothetical protein